MAATTKHTPKHKLVSSISHQTYPPSGHSLQLTAVSLLEGNSDETASTAQCSTVNQREATVAQSSQETSH